ncbi:putative carbohydrate esterase [Panicum miliaceum]|uniref:Carbohydrate esterase n=1 Tax=Panicum miliaceum TaxID=4540 RepID=A0A3L6Q2L3_PANMI|nr:putative carbohydrate esterase [Panicum miliaceum]
MASSRLSSSLRWEEAREPLQAGIDVGNVLGVGPGMPFAHAVLAGGKGVAAVGLVPCAQGGTPIANWTQGTELYERMVTRARAAMDDGCGELAALLWYQGEADAMRREDAVLYQGRMEALVRSVRRDLGTGPISSSEEINDEEADPALGGNDARRNYLTNEQCQQMYEALLERSKNGKLYRDTTTIVADLFGVKRRVVQRIWTTVKRCKAAGSRDDTTSKRALNCGRKRVHVDFEETPSSSPSTTPCPPPGLLVLGIYDPTAAIAAGPSSAAAAKHHLLGLLVPNKPQKMGSWWSPSAPATITGLSPSLCRPPGAAPHPPVRVARRSAASVLISGETPLEWEATAGVDAQGRRRGGVGEERDGARAGRPFARGGCGGSREMALDRGDLAVVRRCEAGDRGRRGAGRPR